MLVCEQVHGLEEHGEALALFGAVRVGVVDRTPAVRAGTTEADVLAELRRTRTFNPVIDAARLHRGFSRDR